MITTTALYQAEAANLNRRPVYRAKFYGNYVREVLRDAPSGFWRLDDTNATALDLSGNSLSGAYNGGYTQSQTGPFVFDATLATLLNGATGYVSVADADLLDLGVDTFTLEAWVNISSFAGGPTLFDKGTGGYAVYFTTAGKVVLAKKDTADIQTSLVAIAANFWAHVAVTKSGSTVHVYVNGVDVTGAVSNQTIAAAETDLNIGRLVTNAQYLPGLIANAAIYPTALSAVRVRAHYDCGMDTLFPTEYSTHPIHANYLDEILADGPSGYYRLGEASGSALDSSGNGYAGTVAADVVRATTGALTGDSDKAAYFPGTANSYVDVPSGAFDPRANTNWSMEIWAQPDAVAFGSYMACGWFWTNPSTNGAYLYKSTDQWRISRAQAGTTVTVISAAGTAVVGVYAHVVATYDGVTLRLYVNGKLAASGAAAVGAMQATVGNPRIGHAYLSGKFDGHLDEATFYNGVVLSADRISAHYDAGKMNFYRRDVSDYLAKPSIGASQVIPERGQCSVGPLEFVLNDQADYDSEVMADAPSMYLPLNELKGSLAYDRSGNALSGIYYGSPQFGQRGPIAYGPDWGTLFNGTSQQVIVADNNLLDDGDVFSLEAWIYHSAASKGQILSKGGGAYDFEAHESGYLRLNKDTTNQIAISSSTMSLNTWYHVMATKNGSDVHLYINGVDVTGAVTNFALVSTATDLNVGRGYTGINYFAGSLARVAIYPTALSAARVLAHYNAALARPGTSCNGSATRLISQRLSGQPCVFSMGFDGITEGNYVASAFRGIVDSNPLTADLSAYKFTVNDPQTMMNVQVFNPASTTLLTALTNVATTSYVKDDTDFMSSGYAVIENEVVQYTGKSTNHGISPSTAMTKTVYGNGNFVGCKATATGVNDIWYSSDGKNWYNSSSGVAGTATLIFGNGKHVLLSQSTGFGAYSTDGGLTWSTPFAISNKIWAAGCWASGLSKYVALSATDFVMTSSDGFTWSAAAAMAAGSGVSPGSWSQMLWDSGTSLLVAVSDAPGGSTRAVVTSPDAAAFTLRVTAASTIFEYLMSSGSLFVAGGPNYWATSTDAVTWTSQTGLNTNAGVYCSDLGLFVTAGILNHISTTPDGVTWTTQTGPTSGGIWTSVATNSAGIVVITGGSSASQFVGYSTNATAWTTYVSQLTGMTRGVLGTTAAAHAAGVAIQEMIRIGPGHPVTLFLNILQRTDKVGANIPSTLLDVAAIQAMVATLGSSYQMEWRITAAANLLTWSQTEFFQALALFPIRSSGKYSMKMITTISAAVATIDEDSSFEFGWNDNFKNSIVNQAVVLWDYDVVAKAFATSKKFPTTSASILRYGVIPVPPIQSHGFRSELPGTIDMITNAIQTRLIARYQNGVPLVTTRPFASKNILEPGDDIYATSTTLPGRTAGARGVANAPVQIVEIAHDLKSGYSQLVAVWPDW